MVEAQSRQFLDNFKMQLAQQGLQYDQYMKATGMDEAQLLADAKEPALKQVRMDLPWPPSSRRRTSTPPMKRWRPSSSGWPTSTAWSLGDREEVSPG